MTKNMARSIGWVLVVALVVILALEVTAEGSHKRWNDKVGARLQHFLNVEDSKMLPKRSNIRDASGEDVETTAIWVLFNSKCSSTSQTLSSAAIARRAKHGFTRSDADLPLCTNHKAAVDRALQVLSHRVTERHESKWLNGVSYIVAIRDLEQAISILQHLPFIGELEVVARFIRPRDEFDELGHHDTQSMDTFTSSTQDASAHDNSVHSENEHSTHGTRQTHVLDYGSSAPQLQRMNIPQLHDAGLDGSGVIITVLDSGFNRQHQSLVNLNVLAVYDFVGNDTDVSDAPGENAHSSHGTGTWSNIGAKYPGQLYGGSYGATFILCKTENPSSETSIEEDNFVRAIEWSEGLGASILSASLGYDGWYNFAAFDGQHSIISRAGNLAIDMGMLFVVANGNAANRGIGTPADMNRVLSLGALGLSNDVIATFSSWGPTADGRYKPEVSAPGSQIKVASYNNVNGYSQMSGTSFATPLTAGVAGLLWQAHPDWTNMNIRDAIIQTATPKGTSSPNFQFGWGVVNAAAANSWTPPTDLQSQCTEPYGVWNSATEMCDCNAGFYNSNCRSTKLSCRQWCPGLCAVNGTCMCSGSIAQRCVVGRDYISTWTCSASQYNDGNVCNCGCGLWDPDCSRSELPTFGCRDLNDRCTLTSSNTGVCTAPPSPPAFPIDPPVTPINPPPTPVPESTPTPVHVPQSTPAPVPQSIPPNSFPVAPPQPPVAPPALSPATTPPSGQQSPSSEETKPPGHHKGGDKEDHLQALLSFVLLVFSFLAR